MQSLSLTAHFMASLYKNQNLELRTSNSVLNSLMPSYVSSSIFFGRSQKIKLCVHLECLRLYFDYGFNAISSSSYANMMNLNIPNKKNFVMLIYSVILAHGNVNYKPQIHLRSKQCKIKIQLASEYWDQFVVKLLQAT